MRGYGEQPRVNFTIRRLDIPDVLLIDVKRFGDARGYFMETFRASDFAGIGITTPFVQENQAFSAQAGTIRGLHFQAPPHAQAKLVRVLQGAILDVAVDLRKDSPSFGKWVAAELGPDDGHIYVPRGFAHGYCTLAADTTIVYKCDDYYAPETEGGVHFSDPDLAIGWPDTGGAPIVSDKDIRLPGLKDITTPF